MSPVLLGIIGLAVVLLLWKAWGSRPTLDAEVLRAVEDKDEAAVITTISNLRESAQPDAFNHAIKRLWDDYERELAARLVRELASRHPRELISQYWLDQLQNVEPEIAKRVLDKQFIRDHYRPDVAARCGSFG